jgi:hypothetical protein
MNAIEFMQIGVNIYNLHLKTSFSVVNTLVKLKTLLGLYVRAL